MCRAGGGWLRREPIGRLNPLTRPFLTRAPHSTPPPLPHPRPIRPEQALRIFSVSILLILNAKCQGEPLSAAFAVASERGLCERGLCERGLCEPDPREEGFVSTYGTPVLKTGDSSNQAGLWHASTSGGYERIYNSQAGFIAVKPTGELTCSGNQDHGFYGCSARGCIAATCTAAGVDTYYPKRECVARWWRAQPPTSLSSSHHPRWCWLAVGLPPP